MITATDAALAGGAPGIMSTGTGAVDNWVGGNMDGSTPVAPTYGIGGTISGLSGTVTLQDNGGDAITQSASGAFTFPTQLASGAAYSVTVAANPANQACTVTNGSGTVTTANVANVAVTCSSTSLYSVGGTISGLSGTAVLQDNGGDNLSVTANGSFTFATRLASGAAYSVTVASSPSGQTCAVASGSAAIGSANVTSVTVTCTTNATNTTSASDNFQQADGSLSSNWTATADGGLTISGGQAVGQAVNGNSGDMWTGSTFTSDQYSQVTLTSTQLTGTQWIGPMVRAQGTGGKSAYVGIYFWNNGSPQLLLFLRSNGNWSQLGTAFSISALPAGAVVGLSATGSTISLTLNGTTEITSTDTTLTGGAPGLMTNGPAHAAAWAGGSGTPTPTYTVGGTLSGLTGTVTLQDNGGDTLIASANGSFTFAAQLASGAAYSVTVATNPTAQSCTVASGTGTVASANVSSVVVTCAAVPTYSVGGIVSGLSGTVTLQDNGADTTSVSANGAFTFPTKLASGASYSATLTSSPSGQACTLANNQGTMGAADVTGITVTCAAVPTYSVGGIVNGLSGTVALQDNGGDTLQVSASGSFTFATQLASGAAYNVTVQASPSGQTCTVGSGSGTVSGAAVTSVTVTCAASSSATSASDNFQRANGSLGSNWTATADGGLTISTDVAVGAAGNSGDMWTASSFTSDQYAQVTLTSTQLTGTQWVGPMVRAQGTGGQSGYVAIYFWNNGAPEVMLFLRSSGNWSQLGSAYSVSALPAGTVLGLAVAGAALTVTVNGTTDIAATNTALAGGAPGLMTNGAAAAAAWAGGSGALPGSGGGTTGTTYSVGGTVSGLTAAVTLTDNGADTLNVAANGSFTFATTMASGATYSVAVAANPSGQSCTVANGSGTVASANVTSVTVSCAATTTLGSMTASYASTDSNGIATYNVTSPIVNDGATEPLRVLTPTAPAVGVAHNFLIALPVEVGEGTTYGDGISYLKSLNAQNDYNVTIIEPSFSIDPWYADSATDPAMQMETFMTSQLVPWIKANLAVTGTEQVWLLGFSKSGLGAQDLLLKHPSVYTLAATWDFPADMTSYNQLGTSPQTAYGTNANYLNNYALTQAFVNAHAAPFTVYNRIWIGSYYYFEYGVNSYYGPSHPGGRRPRHRWADPAGAPVGQRLGPGSAPGPGRRQHSPRELRRAARREVPAGMYHRRAFRDPLRSRVTTGRYVHIC